MSNFTDRMNNIHDYNFGNNQYSNQCNNHSNNHYNQYNYYNVTNSSSSSINTSSSSISSSPSSTKGYAVIHANDIPLWFSQKHCKTG